MKQKENKKIKISSILLILLVIAAVVLIISISIVITKRNKNEQEVKQVIAEVSENLQEDPEGEIPYIDYDGYQVIGTIKIEKINIEYPILAESTEDSLKKSICRFGNGKVNEIGNLCLAGHNYLNGVFFGKANNLGKDDEISITDLHGNEVIYKIFDKYKTNPNDTSVLKSVEEGRREITLITCINGNQDRLIIRASEI